MLYKLITFMNNNHFWSPEHKRATGQTACQVFIADCNNRLDELRQELAQLQREEAAAYEVYRILCNTKRPAAIYQNLELEKQLLQRKIAILQDALTRATPENLVQVKQETSLQWQALVNSSQLSHSI